MDTLPDDVVLELARTHLSLSSVAVLARTCTRMHALCMEESVARAHCTRVGLRAGPLGATWRALRAWLRRPRTCFALDPGVARGGKKGDSDSDDDDSHLVWPNGPFPAALVAANPALTEARVWAAMDVEEGDAPKEGDAVVFAHVADGGRYMGVFARCADGSLWTERMLGDRGYILPACAFRNWVRGVPVAAYGGAWAILAPPGMQFARDTADEGADEVHVGGVLQLGPFAYGEVHVRLRCASALARMHDCSVRKRVRGEHDGREWVTVAAVLAADSQLLRYGWEAAFLDAHPREEFYGSA